MTDTGARAKRDDPAPLTPRAQAKAQRRVEILVAAARLMARRGFHGVRLDDIGADRKSVV